jgi:hypothetical protein
MTVLKKILQKALPMIALVLAALFSTQMGWAQSLKINALFDSTTIVIGDQVKLRIEVDQPQKTKVQFPAFKDTINSKIEVIKTFKSDTIKNGDKLHITQEFLVTSFDSGDHYVAPIAFPFEMGPIKDTLRSVALHLRVLTLPVDTTKDIRDIKPPYRARIGFAEIWPFLLILLAAVLLGFGIWFLIKKLKKEPVFLQRKTFEPAHIIAIRDLDKLRGEKLWQSGKTKLYYTRLTEIIRLYIENRFNVKALEMTSDEIIGELKDAILQETENIALAQKIFTTADLVKFAKSQPLPDENEVSMLDAYQFVNNTKLVFTAPVVEEKEDDEKNKS